MSRIFTCVLKLCLLVSSNEIHKRVRVNVLSFEYPPRQNIYTQCMRKISQINRYSWDNRCELNKSLILLTVHHTQYNKPVNQPTTIKKKQQAALFWWWWWWWWRPEWKTLPTTFFFSLSLPQCSLLQRSQLSRIIIRPVKSSYIIPFKLRDRRVALLLNPALLCKSM